MTLGRMRSWYRQSLTMQTVLGEIEGQLDELRAHKQLTDPADNKKQLLAIESDLARGQRDYDRMQLVFFERLRVGNMEDAERFMVDLGIKLQATEKLFKVWREFSSSLDLLAGTGQLRDDETEDDDNSSNSATPTRREFEESVTNARLAYEVQLTLADNLIPSSVVLI